MGNPRHQPDPQRFQTDYDVARLIGVMRIVAAYANPADPESATPSAYEASRAPAGFPDAPGARATRRALGNLGWYELLHLAFHPSRSLEHNLGLASRGSARYEVPEAEAVAALSIIASRLSAETLRPHEYNRELAAMERRTGPTGLPTADRIEAALKTDTEMGWDRGLRLAGLAPRGPVHKPQGVSWPRAIAMFVEEVGYVPTVRLVRDYARQKGFSLRRHAAGYRDHVETARREFERKGMPWPRRRYLPRQRPPLEVAPMANPPVPIKDSLAWDDPERVIAGLIRAYDIAGKRRLRLTQKVHRDLAREFTGDIPAPSVVDRQAKKHGSTALAWREEAQRRRLKP